MKILLINPLVQVSMWENNLVENWPPLGHLYLGAVLEQQGHTVKLIERKRIAASAGHLSHSEEALADIDRLMMAEVARFAPDLVGVTATTALIMDGYRAARCIRKQTDAPIVFGGYHPTFDPARTLRDCEAIDVVVAGEGEVAMSEIVAGAPMATIDGIAYRNEGEIVVNRARKPMTSIEHLPFPARHLLDVDFYFAPSAGLIRGIWARGTTIFTARGCPFECTFCQSPQFTRLGKGKSFRGFSPEYVVREIEHLVHDYGIEAVLFAEDIFNIDRKRSLAICDLLISSGLSKKVVWAADMRVDLCDPELLQRMARANCVRVIYGTESGSQETLNSIKKKATVEEAVRAIRLTKEAGITCEANIIIGLPGERPRDFLDTIDFLKAAKPDMVNRGKFFPLPGTGLYYSLRGSGQVEDHENWDDVMDYYTRGDFTFTAMSVEEFEALRSKFDREVVLPTNYMFSMRTNWRRNPLFALQQFALMLGHVGVLYLPLKVQKIMRKLAEKLRVKSRYVVPIGKYRRPRQVPAC